MQGMANVLINVPANILECLTRSCKIVLEVVITVIMQYTVVVFQAIVVFSKTGLSGHSKEDQK